MAGDWIKVESATPDKPEVLRLCRALGISRAAAFGAVVIFWAWLDKHSSDGQVDGVVEADVDALVAIDGFAGAMQSVGWLAIDRKTPKITVPHFDRLNGQSAKNRALKNDRQSRWREGKAEPKLAMSAPEQSPKPQRAKKGLLPLPDDWQPSAATIERLVAQYRFLNGDAERYIAAFRDACKAKGYEYKDFDAAFSNCVRQDWPKFRAGAAVMPKRTDPNKPSWT